MSAADIIPSLASEKNWKEIIRVGSALPLEEKKRILWAWPTEQNLNFLRNTLNELNLQMILSIGCGTGLLEWIVKESTGINVVGVERDELWWNCKHSPSTFVKLHFIEESVQISETFLKNCTQNTDFALFFCYFNNMEAFHRYLEVYQKFGKCLIIIGPGDDKNIFTEPSPFHLGLGSQSNWILLKFCKIGKSNDYIAVYVKK